MTTPDGLHAQQSSSAPQPHPEDPPEEQATPPVDAVGQFANPKLDSFIQRSYYEPSARDVPALAAVRRWATRRGHETPHDLVAAVRLPRFDRAALRTASTSSARRLRVEAVIGDLRYVQRDAGRDRLDVLVEAFDDSASGWLMPCAVSTARRTSDYFLIFRIEESGRWVAAIRVPGIRDSAQVYVHETRPVVSLDAGDAATVARSVRVSPDPWVPAWQAVALGRPDGDPIRLAISGALGS